jgi:hypothetical protein
MRVIFASVISAVMIWVITAMPVSAQVQTDLNDDTQIAYAYAMNDLSVQIVAVIYNYAGMVYEAYEGGTLDSTNAQLELEYVENILYKSNEAINGIVSTVDEGHPVYEILHPHMLCYDYFIDYTTALYTYFGDPSDDNYQAVLDTREAVEPYMSDIGLIIETRGEGSGGEG